MMMMMMMMIMMMMILHFMMDENDDSLDYSSYPCWLRENVKVMMMILLIFI